MSWTNFRYQFELYECCKHKSCYNNFLASGFTPVNNSFMYIDHLAFSGSSTYIKENTANLTNFTFFPNTSNEKIVLNYTLKPTENIVIRIMDVTSKVVKELKPNAVIDNNKMERNISNFS